MKYIFIKIDDGRKALNLPKGIGYDNNRKEYRISLCNNGRNYIFAYCKKLDECKEKYNNILNMINEYGFDYAYEHRKDFQNNPIKENEMKNIYFDERSKIYIFYIMKNNKKFFYSNKDLEKVKEVKNYYLENGEEATIEKYNLYRNDNPHEQMIMNYKENKTLKSNNTSGFNNVFWNSSLNKWDVNIRENGIRYKVGSFDTKEEAIKHRDIANEKGIKWYRANKNNLFELEKQ